MADTRHGRGGGEAGPFDVFLKSAPGQNAILATVVMLAGQAAAQIGLPPPWPTRTAIGFALLVAVYNVRTVQKWRGLNCLVLIPIVALIAFTSGWGANGLVGVATPGGQVHPELESLVDALQKENASLEQRLQLQTDELTILRKLSGVPSPAAGQSGLPRNRPAPLSSFLRPLLEAFAPSAHAQSTTTTTEKTLTPAEREKLLVELREKQGQQKALADETEKLRKEREKAEQNAQQRPLWRKW
jgi:hypothetical protein